MPATLARAARSGAPSNDDDHPTNSSGNGAGRGVAANASIAASRRLRTSFAAVRVSFTWFGVRKSLSAQQKAQAAEHFGAEGRYLSAAKKLLDTKHEAFGQVTSLRSQIISYWKGLSLPLPRAGRAADPPG